MKTFLPLIGLFFGLALVSCKKNVVSADGQLTGELAVLEEEVMRVHDDVMPKLSDINELLGQLRTIRENIQPTPEGSLVLPDGFASAFDNLKLAEHNMWEWMKAYTDKRNTLNSEDEFRAFFVEQKQSVSKVSTDIYSALEEANQWLAAYSPNVE